MGKLFSYDSPIFQMINKIVDCVLLSFLWLLFTIPVITSGAATTALYYTVNKVVRHDRSHIWREFWGAFKSNFKQSTIVWIIQIVLYYILIADCILMYGMYKNGGSIVPLVIFAAMTAFVTMWAIYLSPCMARFENTIKQLMKNCVFFMFRHLLTSIAALVVLCAAIVVVVAIPVAVLLAPTIYMLILNFLMERIFRKYMSEEDREAEDERNRKYYN